MTASRQFKGLLAGVAAVALIGTAMAQGNPPNPAVKSAPVGAGQQSSQQTPMGTTGTPAGGGTAATTGGGKAAATGSTSSSGTPGTAGSGSSMGSSTTSADTSMSTGSKKKRAVRVARADRN